MHYRAIIICWLCCGLSCCSQNETDSCIQPAWALQSSIIKQANNWVATGSASLQSGHSHHMGYFTWAQQGADFTIDISGPMHIPIATIEGDAQGSVVHTAESAQPITLSQWMQQYIGYPVGDSALRAMLLGRPQTNNLSWRYHYPYQAHYQHYHVTWERYHCFPIGYRPQKIAIELDPEHTLTIFVHDWYERYA